MRVHWTGELVSSLCYREFPLFGIAAAWFTRGHIDEWKGSEFVQSIFFLICKKLIPALLFEGSHSMSRMKQYAISCSVHLSTKNKSLKWICTGSLGSQVATNSQNSDSRAQEHSFFIILSTEELPEYNHFCPYFSHYLLRVALTLTVSSPACLGSCEVWNVYAHFCNTRA